VRSIDALILTNEIVENSIKETLESKSKIATRETINSIRSIVKVSDSGYIGEVWGAGGLKFIESGRKPNSKMPPSGVLLPWMRSKGIEEDKEFIIRRSIARKGIKPTKIIAPALKETSKQRIQILRGAVANEIFKSLVKDL
jgi:hypothetical protein